MLEELTLLNGSRLLLLGSASYTIWSLHGIFFRGWSVGEMFFWSWWDLLFSGLSTTLLVHRWQQVTQTPVRSGNGPFGVLFSVLLVLLFATLFTGLALAAENISVVQGTLKGFIRERLRSVGTIAFLFLMAHLFVSRRARLLQMSLPRIMIPLNHRMWPVLGLYLILICDHHWHGRDKLDTSQGHQLLMGGSLLGIKLCMDLRALWRGWDDAPAAGSA